MGYGTPPVAELPDIAPEVRPRDESASLAASSVQMPASEWQLDERGFQGGWLCPTQADRARLLDMSAAVRRSRLLSSLFCGLGVIALTPWHPLLLALFALVPGPLLMLDRGFGAVSGRSGWSPAHNSSSPS